jgi:signal transduction histidine kinase
MKLLSGLNSIAARIAIAIILATCLIIPTVVGVSWAFSSYRPEGEDGAHSHLIVSRSQIGVINPRNPMALSGGIAVIIRAVASTPQSERPRIVAAITQPDLQVAIGPTTPAGAPGSTDEMIERLRQYIEMQLEGFPDTIHVRAGLLSDSNGGSATDAGSELRSGGTISIEADLQDGQRITFTARNFSPYAGYGLFLFLGAVVFVAVLVSILTAHRLAAPISDFAAAADRLGVDLTAPPLAERGPRELRATIRIVNRMQQRLQRFLQDRTQMLAAISHDLRAPLARLRLRIELVADREQQRKMFDDLEAMNTMIDSTLAFARDEARQEPRSLVDLGILVGDVCEDMSDAGGEVSYDSRRGTDISCRPTMIRRAVANLVDNAVKYGGCARVQIIRKIDSVIIVVDDDGPGVPPEEQEEVFTPFYRRDPARDPAKAGVGLGLSIARTVAREHGGDVTIQNRESGGLSARIELPALAGPAPSPQ